MGVSAGSVCWFQGGTTDSFGLPLRPVSNGASAWHLTRDTDGHVSERRLETRLLA
jgi:hypothetical protein